MTYPVCVRLVRPEPEDRPTVYRWLTSAHGDGATASPHAGAAAGAPYDAFLRRFPLHYFEHSDKERGRMFLVAVGDTLVGAIAHGEVVDTADGKRVCTLGLWLSGPEVGGRGIGAHALDHLCERLPDDMGVGEVALMPSASDLRALRACRRAGFTPSSLAIAEAGRYYGGAPVHQDAVCVVRALSHGPVIGRTQNDFDRSQLMELFRFADDSDESILRYRDQGVLYVLYGAEGGIIGQMLVCRHAYAASATIESLSLSKCHRGRGLGTALVRGVLARLTDEGVSQVEVGTAAADTGNLRFYQYLGFRLRTVQRDFFRPPDYPVLVDPRCIPLRDRVVCDIALTSATVRGRKAPAD